MTTEGVGRAGHDRGELRPPRPVALVTGASSGIGHATALALAAAGHRLVVTARRADRLAALAERCEGLGAETLVVPGDLADADFANRLVSRGVEQFGRLDVLVNNAAIPLHKSIYETSLADVERAMRVNFLAAVATTLAAIPVMTKQRQGVIVNVSSFAAKVVPTHESGYAASKAALDAWSEGLWNDLHGSGIHVALVHPGPIETEIWTKLDRPAGFSGKRYPAELVADAVLDAIRERRFEQYVPSRHLGMTAARWLRVLFPALLRRGVRANDPPVAPPIPPSVPPRRGDPRERS